jgi:hypothetical protein
MRMTFIALPLILVTACAANPDSQISEAKSPACVREYHVGSNIPVLTCSTPQTDAERQRAIDEVKNQIRPAPPPLSKGGAGS